MKNYNTELWHRAARRTAEVHGENNKLSVKPLCNRSIKNTKIKSYITESHGEAQSK
jgi:hypothetical protein